MNQAQGVKRYKANVLMAKEAGREPRENSLEGREPDPPSDNDIAELIRRLAKSGGKGLPVMPNRDEERFSAPPATQASRSRDQSAVGESGKKRSRTLIAVIIFGALFAVALLGAVIRFQNPFVESARNPAPKAIQEEQPASRAEPQTSPAPADLQFVQKAMADCDREAAQDRGTLYLLLIPLRRNTDGGQSTAPPGERYESFFLTTSKAALDGLQEGSYSLNLWPFGFAVIDSANKQTKSWNMVAGVTRLTHSADGFSKFQVGFDIASRGYGMRWSNEYSRQTGTCYWINVQFQN
jgi:hypothetical protein